MGWPRRSRRSQDTATRIRQSALRLFAKRGYEATGIRDVARDAGLSLATLYHYKPPMRDKDDDPPVVPAPEYGRYDEVYGFAELLNMTAPELVAEMERSQVRGILQAEHEWGEDAEYNDRVAELLQRYPDRFASVDPRQPMEAVRELNRAHGELGLRGAIFEPGFLKISPADACCYPIYARCTELGIPVGLHTGINFSSHGPIENGRPLLVDKVACDFPDLTIICHHGGWP